MCRMHPTERYLSVEVLHSSRLMRDDSQCDRVVNSLVLGTVGDSLIVILYDLM